MIARLGSVTDLTEQHRGQVVLVGSHGGKVVGTYAARFKVGALIVHDAGVGLDGAGVGALEVLGNAGIAAAAVSHNSARIGDPDDMTERGLISHVNFPALQAGVFEGMSAMTALGKLERSAILADGKYAHDVDFAEFRRFILEHSESADSRQPRRVIIMDSASDLIPEDDGQIVVTGSHGGLPGGKAIRAAKAQPFFIAFNDAGIGADNAGISRLPVLDEKDVAAVCVHAHSARIGDGLSTYENGIISSTNRAARRLGASENNPLKPLIDKLAGVSDWTPETLAKI
jgi:hypothetical protein